MGGFFGRIFWEELMFLSRFCSNARKEEFRSLEVRGKLITLEKLTLVECEKKRKIYQDVFLSLQEL